MADGEIAAAHPAAGRSRTSIARIAGGGLAVAAVLTLLALVPILAGVRADFAPWVPVTPGQSDAASFDRIAFALLSGLGSGVGLVAITGAAVIVLIAAGRRSDAAFVGIAVFGAVIVSRAFKYYYHAPRPWPDVSVASSIGFADAVVAVAVGVVIAVALLVRWHRWVIGAAAVAAAAAALEAVAGALMPLTTGFDAFPSGHAIFSMTLASAAVQLAWASGRARLPVLAVAALYVLGVGLSRVYLRAHFPADVVAGWCVALAWTIGLRLVWVALERWGRLRA